MFSLSNSLPHSCPLLTWRSSTSPEHDCSTEAFPNLRAADSSGCSWQRTLLSWLENLAEERSSCKNKDSKTHIIFENKLGF